MGMSKRVTDRPFSPYRRRHDLGILRADVVVEEDAVLRRVHAPQEEGLAAFR